MGKVIGVLCGGPSRERDISIRSGQAVYDALRSLGLSVSLVVLSENTYQIPDEIRLSGLHTAFIALHGRYGEDGTVQALLEQMKIPYTGSSAEACRYAMDKVHSRRRWAAAGIPVPEWKLTDAMAAVSQAEKMKFPLVVKPVSEGSSIGISIVDSADQLSEAVAQAAPRGGPLLLEEYLPGAELTVGILNNQPLPVIQVVPKRRFYDYVAKYTPGMTNYLVPAPLPEPIAKQTQEIARRAHEALGCGSFSRVDFILAEGRGPVVLELNAIPGMTASSLLPKAAALVGISFPELCRTMLESAYLRSSAMEPAG